MIGMSLHSRSRRQSSMPSMSGSTRSMIAASGRADGGAGRAPPRRCGGQRLEAGVAQDHPQRAQDLRLVVADEHLRLGRALTHGGAAGSAGRRARPSRQRDRRSSCPGRAATRPRSCRRWPRRSPSRSPARGPSPVHAGAALRAAVEGLEDPLLLAGGDPRALVGDADQHARARRAARGRDTGWPPRSSARAFSSRLANARSSWRGVGAQLRARRGRSTSAHLDRLAAQSLARRRAPPRSRPSHAAAAARPPAAARGRAACRRAPRAASPSSTTAALSSRALLVGQRRRAERVAGGDDRGQRRAQVVRDGAQQRGLDVVAAAQRRGLDRLGLHRVAAQGDGDERLERGHDLRRAARCVDLGREIARDEQRRELAAPSRVAQRGTRRGARLPATAPSSIAADASPSASATRRAALPQRVAGCRSPASSSRASAAARSASRAPPLGLERARAGQLGHRARRPAATITNAASATQLRLSAIVNWPAGGRWKKLNAAALSSEVEQPSASPQ